MESLGKQITAGTQHLAHQARLAARSAGASIVAGLRSCDEKNADLAGHSELRVEIEENIARSKPVTAPAHSGGAALFGPFLDAITSVPSTSLALSASPGKDSSAQTQSSQLDGRVWGSNVFGFRLRLMDSGSSVGYLVAAARRHANAEWGSLPIRCRWRRSIGDHSMDIPNVFGTEYPVSADDICCSISVEAVPIERHKQLGTAFGEIGPFELDPKSRMHLENYLAMGTTRFPVTLISVNRSPSSQGPRWLETPSGRTDGLEESYDLHLSSNELCLIQSGGASATEHHRQWTSPYGADFPRVVLSTIDLVAFELILGGSPNDDDVSLGSTEAMETLRLRTVSRSVRDLLTLTIRCYHGCKHVAQYMLLRGIALSSLRSGDFREKEEVVEYQSRGAGRSSALAAYGESGGISPMDLILLIQSISSQLYTSLSKAERSNKEKERVLAEKDALEQDMNSTIQVYQQLLSTSDLGASRGTLPSSTSSTPGATLDLTGSAAARVAELESKLQDAKMQSAKYVEQLENLRRDYRNCIAKGGATGKGLGRGGVSATTTGALWTNSKFLDLSGTALGVTTPPSYEYASAQSSPRKGGHRFMETTTRDPLLQDTVDERDRRPSEPTRDDRSSERLRESTEAVKALEEEKLRLEKDIENLRSINAELQENFLYVKSKLNSLQEAQAEAEQRLLETTQPLMKTTNLDTMRDTMTVTGSNLSSPQNSAHRGRRSDGSSDEKMRRELQLVREQLEEATTDRNRLTRKFEAARQELAKCKRELEVQTQTLLNVNQKLSAEKASAEEHIKNLETTVSEKALSISKLETTLQGEAHSVTYLRQQLAERDQQLAAKDAIIDRLQKETEMLRKRVRILAESTSQ